MNYFLAQNKQSKIQKRPKNVVFWCIYDAHVTHVSLMTSTSDTKEEHHPICVNELTKFYTLSRVSKLESDSLFRLFWFQLFPNDYSKKWSCLLLITSSLGCK